MRKLGPGRQLWPEATIDCDEKVNMKDVSMVINGKEFVLTPEDYILDIEV